MDKYELMDREGEELHLFMTGEPVPVVGRDKGVPDPS